MALPQFLLVGAPKSGTTAFDQYLSEHPDVFMAPKELHHFGRDLDFVAPRISRADYEARFDAAPPGAVRGESSVWYLYSTRAAEEIAAAIPDARIVALQRDPVDMIYALHREFLFNGNEDLVDFGDALRAQDRRRRGEALPSTVLLPCSLQYVETARYARQLERYFRVFGRERVLVLLYDDFLRDPRATYTTLLDFLGLADDGRVEFPVVNPNREVRASASVRSGGRLVTVGRTLVPSRRARRALRGAVHRRLVRPLPRPPMDPALREELRGQLEPELVSLGDLLGRDVTHWGRGVAAAPE